MSTSSVATSRRFPWRLILKIFTAFIGGYLFANTFSIFFAVALPSLEAYAVAYGLLLSFFYWAGAAMWVFTFQSLWRSCGVIWLAVVILGGASWLFKSIGGGL